MRRFFLSFFIYLLLAAPAAYAQGCPGGCIVCLGIVSAQACSPSSSVQCTCSNGNKAFPINSELQWIQNCINTKYPGPGYYCLSSEQ